MELYIAALLPVMLAIGLGYVLRLVNFISRDGWSAVEKLVYYLLFPALLLQAIAGKNLNHFEWQSLLQLLGIALGLASLVLFLWFKLFANWSGATFTSVYQGGIRFNTFIMLSVAWSYYGESGLQMGSVIAGFMIFFINILCVLVFLIWGEHGKRGWKKLFVELFTNPLIVACLIGLFINVSDQLLPVVLDELLLMLGKAALPLGLLAVGAALDLKIMHQHAGTILPATMVQFGLKPLTVFYAAQWLGLSSLMSAVLLIAFTTPTSPSSYILARQLGGDSTAMASIVSFQTFLALLAMPAWAWFLLG